MQYKFDNSIITSEEIKIAEKASELFSKFIEEIKKNNLYIDDIRIRYSINNRNHWLTISK